VHSGGAKGADSLFAEVFNQHNYNIIHHSFNDHNIKSKVGEVVRHSDGELFSDQNRIILKMICNYLNRQYPKNRYIERLLLRNIYQVRDTKLVLGVGYIQDNNSCIVKGGTGYAIGYAVLHNISILFLNQSNNIWYYSYDGQGFKQLNRKPELSKFPNIFTAIGSRDLTNQAINEITTVFKKKVTTYGIFKK